MYRRYEGNSGRSRRVEEPRQGRYQGKLLAPLPEQNPNGQKPQGQKAQEQRPPEPPADKGKKPSGNPPPGPLSGLSGELGKLFGKLGSLSLETEDLLLIAVLYLMYRESGDKELLIMIGALLFL